MATHESSQKNLARKFCSEWPWQSSPESWVFYLLRWLVESDISHVFLNPSTHGGVALTFRWDGLILKG